MSRSAVPMLRRCAKHQLEADNDVWHTALRPWWNLEARWQQECLLGPNLLLQNSPHTDPERDVQLMLSLKGG